MLLSLALVLVIVVVAWSVHTVLSNGGVLSDDSTAAGREPHRAGTQVLTECAAQLAAADAVVSSARDGVAAWHAHVQARTDRLRKEISKRQMEAVWDRTREAGHREQEVFTAALSEYHGTPSCDRLASGSRTARSDACVDRAAAARAAVSAAEAAMGEWREHLQHMEMNADGGMTAGSALQLWIAMWRKAPANITSFEDSAAALSAAPRCEAS